MTDKSALRKLIDDASLPPTLRRDALCSFHDAEFNFEGLPPHDGWALAAKVKIVDDSPLVFLISKNELIPNNLTHTDCDTPFARRLVFTDHRNKSLAELQKLGDVLCFMLEHMPLLREFIGISDTASRWRTIKGAAGKIAFPHDKTLLNLPTLESDATSSNVSVDVSYVDIQGQERSYTVKIPFDKAHLHAEIPPMTDSFQRQNFCFPADWNQQPRSEIANSTAKLLKTVELLDFVQRSLHAHIGTPETMKALENSIVHSFFPDLCIVPKTLKTNPFYKVEKRNGLYVINPTPLLQQLLRPVHSAFSSDKGNRVQYVPSLHINARGGRGALLTILDALHNEWRLTGDARMAWDEGCKVADSLNVSAKLGLVRYKPDGYGAVHTCGFCSNAFERAVVKFNRAGVPYCVHCEKRDIVTKKE